MVSMVWHRGRSLLTVVMVIPLLSCVATTRGGLEIDELQQIPMAVLIDRHSRSRIVNVTEVCAGGYESCRRSFQVPAGELLLEQVEEQLGETFARVRTVHSFGEAKEDEVVVCVDFGDHLRVERIEQTINGRIAVTLRLIVLMRSSSGEDIARFDETRQYVFDPRERSNIATDVAELGALIANFTFVATLASGKSVHDLVFVQREYNDAVASAIRAMARKAMQSALAGGDAKAALRWYLEHGYLRPSIKKVMEQAVDQVFHAPVDDKVIAIFHLPGDLTGSLKMSEASEALRSVLVSEYGAIVVDPGLQNRILMELDQDPIRLVNRQACSEFALLSSADWIMTFKFNRDDIDRWVELQVLSPEGCAVAGSARGQLYGR